MGNCCSESEVVVPDITLVSSNLDDKAVNINERLNYLIETKRNLDRIVVNINELFKTKYGENLSEINDRQAWLVYVYIVCLEFKADESIEMKVSSRVIWMLDKIETRRNNYGLAAEIVEQIAKLKKINTNTKLMQDKIALIQEFGIKFESIASEDGTNLSVAIRSGNDIIPGYMFETKLLGNNRKLVETY